MYSQTEILALVRDTVTHPATVKDVARILRIPREEAPAFRRQIKTLIAEGHLVQTRGNRVGLPERMDLVVGRLQVNQGGFGFVVPEGGVKGPARASRDVDVYVAAQQMGEAMHGDRVAVRVERRTPKGLEGRIVSVIERRHADVVGRFEIDREGLGYVVPFDRRIRTDVHVPTGRWSSAESGEMVVVTITEWPTPNRGPVGHVSEVLGRVEEPGVDTQVIIRKHGIPDRHSPAAVAEAAALGGVVREEDLAGRRDFRGVTTVTIDGEHARDFDDAITIERLPNGHYWLGVHIADVSHYVSEGSALDEDAYARGTSVYFPERAVHMFPAELATGLCSLNPDVDRVVQSCLMEVDGSGTVVRHEIHDGVIRSDARMTYTAVAAILTDRDPATIVKYQPFVPMFELMHALFHVLLERRHRRGSIDFDLPEAELVLSEFGEIEGIVATERNVAHRLIEEFMLLANETVAAHLERAGVPALFRVHESPDRAKVDDFEAFVAPLGHSLALDGPEIHPRHFQRLVERIRGTPEERPVAAMMLRTMQKARYDKSSLGHFGLAADHYAHFTSPIRRYPDLVVHRLLRAFRLGEITAARREELHDNLPGMAVQTSAMERRADEAERELLQWKKVRFMARKVGEEFDGYVVGVAPFGLFVELVEHYVDGLVHIASMANDYYRFDEQQHLLRGEHTKKVYRLGDGARVQVVRVDMERRQVELGLTEILEAVRREGRKGSVRAASRTKEEKRRVVRPGRQERQSGTAVGAAGTAKKATRARRASKPRR